MVKRLPANTTSLMQPLDQSTIAAFKAHYIRLVMEWILNMTEEKSIDVPKAWKLFSTLNAIERIDSIIQKLTRVTLNTCWKKIWLEIVTENRDIDEYVRRLKEAEIQKIIGIARSIDGNGFADMNAQDINELLESGKQEGISEEDLVAMFENNAPVDNPEQKEEEEDIQLTCKNLQEGFGLAEKLKDHFMNIDLSAERCAKFKTELRNLLTPYEEVKKQLERKQKIMTDLFSNSLRAA